MATNETGRQGLKTFGRVILIAIIAWAVLLYGVTMCVYPYDLPPQDWINILPQAIDTVSSTLGIALILVGVLQAMRMLASASPPGPTPVVLLAVIILAGVFLLERGWPAVLGLTAVIAVSVLAGAPWRQAVDATPRDGSGT